MKYKKIIFLFSVFLPVSLLLRLVQLSFTVDYATGFFVRDFETNGKAMLWVLIGLCIAPAVFAFTSHRNPENPPSPNLFLSIVAFAAGGAIISGIFFEVFPETVPAWQVAAVKITGLMTALFFVFFGLERFIDFRLPRICAAIPTLYFIFRIICDFTAIAALALTSENLLIMLAYCAVLFFFLQFAKLYNELDSEYNFRKLLSSGLASIMLCFVQTVPHFLLKILTGYSFMHTSVAANINLFFTGVFVAVFLFTHFSFFNACLTKEEQVENGNSFKKKITKICNIFK